MLKFSFGNSKINLLSGYFNIKPKQVACFDLPAGYTCPMAGVCKAYANKVTGKVITPKTSMFRCYAASTEVAFTNVRKLRWYNFDLLRNKNETEMFQIINVSLPKDIKIIRIHSSGDFFDIKYFYAWCKIAVEHPEINFFGYSKVLAYIRHIQELDLSNFKMIYSYGGKQDSFLLDEPRAYVVKYPNDAVSLGVPVACQDNPVDDYEYIMSGKSFALALHGTQPKNAIAMTA
jgi:hypothetical protein